MVIQRPVLARVTDWLRYLAIDATMAAESKFPTAPKEGRILDVHA